MSMSVDLLKFDWKTLVDHLLDNGCNNRYVVEGVLRMYGEKICDKYVILLDEHQDEDSMSMVCHIIESLFGIEDCFDTIYDIDFDYICSTYGGSYIDEEEELQKFAEIIEGDKREK